MPPAIPRTTIICVTPRPTRDIIVNKISSPSRPNWSVPSGGQVEDVLHDNGATNQDRQLQTYQGNHRDEGVLDGVSHDDDPLLEALGPGRPDIVLPQHLQHHGTGQPHGARRSSGAQNQAGNDEHPEIAQRVFGESNQPHRRRPAPPDCRKDNDHQGQPEVRRCQADDGGGAPHIVGGRITANRRVDADWQGYHQPNDDCHDTQLKRHRQSSQYFLLYRNTAAPQ